MTLKELEAQGYTFVYWIHKQQHNDPSTQGYVGITKNVCTRFRQHFLKPNPNIKSIFEKYDDISFTILNWGTRSECLEIEKQFRPEPNIAWNTAKGGGGSPNIHLVGVSKSQEFKQNLSQLLKGNTRASGGKGRKQTPEQIAKRVAATRATKLGQVK